MRHFLVAETLADVLPRLVIQFVVGEGGRHQPGFGDVEGNARGVDAYPAAAPLLGHVGRRAAAAGRVQHQVAGGSAHEHTALDGFR